MYSYRSATVLLIAISSVSAFFIESTESPKPTDVTPFQDIDELLNGTVTEQREALEKLQKMEPQSQSDPDWLVRMSQAYWELALNDKLSEEKKKNYTLTAFEYSKKALQLNDESGHIHKWYAVSLGSCGNYVGLQQKIKDGMTFKKHIQKAMELQKNDAALHHLLGRFYFEVAELSWIERQLASTLFGFAPKGSLDDACPLFLKAEELDDQPWGENELYLAKCSIHFKEYDKTIGFLDKAVDSKPRATDSVGIYDEIKELQNKYKSYRRR